MRFAYGWNESWWARPVANASAGHCLVQNRLVRDGLVRRRPEKTSDCRGVRRLKELGGLDDNHHVRPEIVVRLSFLSVPPRVQQGM